MPENLQACHTNTLGASRSVLASIPPSLPSALKPSIINDHIPETLPITVRPGQEPEFPDEDDM